nr:MAG TPA: hypothetical protein [Caudoviricetes sp.]
MNSMIRAPQVVRPATECNDQIFAIEETPKS